LGVWRWEFEDVGQELCAPDFVLAIKHFGVRIKTKIILTPS